MLTELDMAAGEVERQQILRRFGDVLDPIRRMLIEQEFSTATDVHQRFGIVHLLARSLSDLLAGGHLASHFYLPQAYSVLRPVIDSCDLIELFARSPEQAKRWITTDKGHIEFAPAVVRKLLGRARLDPLHSYFSESGSHPRFRGAQLSGGMVVDLDAPDEQTAVFQVGPLWSEEPSTLHIWLFTFLLAVQTALCGHHLALLMDDARRAEVFWLHAFLECVNASEDGTRLVLAELHEHAHSQVSIEMLKPYASVRAATEATLAVEAESDLPELERRIAEFQDSFLPRTDG
jgi:hypothetical protein